MIRLAHKRHAFRTFSCLFLALLFLVGREGVGAQFVYDPEDEVAFASELVDLGFPDYAEKVVEKFEVDHPDKKLRTVAVRVRILTGRRKFEEAESVWQKMPKGTHARAETGLALANALFVAGQTKKAKDFYKGYFKGDFGMPEGKAAQRFYRDAAYRFSQILERAGDCRGAVQAMDYLLDAKPVREIRRRILAEQSQLCLNVARTTSGLERGTYLYKMYTNTSALCWGGLDLWHGQAITLQAHGLLLEEKRDEAEDLLRDNLDILKEIDKMLVDIGWPRSDSPMARARYLLAGIYDEDGKRLLKNKKKRDQAIKTLLKALNHYYNVYLKYPGSDVGPAAGNRANELVAELEKETGKKLKIPKLDMSSVVESHFKHADALFRDKEYEKAARRYRELLNDFPETGATTRGLANLALCYANEGMTLYARTVAHYAAERFAGDPKAANGLLRLSKYYFDEKQMDTYFEIGELYAERFPKHEHAAMILYSLGEQRWKEQNYRGARAYDLRIKQKYPKDEYFPKALLRTGWGYYVLEEYQPALDWFDQALKAMAPGIERARAKLYRAHSFRKLGRYDESVAEYAELERWLSRPNTPYIPSELEKKDAQHIFEMALFYRGQSHSLVQKPKSAVAEHRKKAVATFRKLAERYPESELAARALSSLGAVYMGTGESTKAAETFEILARKYGTSEAGKDALYTMIRALVEIKSFDQARAKCDAVFADPGRYKPSQFLRIGRLMLDSKQYETAARAFEMVKKSTEERDHLERAFYGLGQALYASGKYEEAAKNLADLLARYEKSGLFFEAKFMLGRAYKAQGEFTFALNELRDVFLKAHDLDLMMKANVDLAEIYVEMGDKQNALSSYQRIALLGNVKDPDMKPTVEMATVKAVDLAVDIRMWKQALDLCDHYLSTFPDGKSLETIRKRKAEARLKLQTSGREGGAE